MSESQKNKSMKIEVAEILLEYLKEITSTENATETELQSVPAVALALNTILREL